MASTQIAQDSLTLRYIDPEQLRVFRGEDGRVYATIAGELTVISPVFLHVSPLTDSGRYLTIRGTEYKESGPAIGREFALLRHWRRLDPDSLRLVEEELERRYLHPRVRSILSVRDYSGVRVAVFETDRGPREVTLRDVRDNIIYFGSNRILITDAEGNRYDIPDTDDLDPDSRARLARIL